MTTGAPSEPPDLWPREEEVLGRLLSARLAVFLDYDGTLTPIVARHDEAFLDPEVRGLLDALSRRCVVAVISGRDLDDVRARVGLDALWYAGSHGFDMAGPGGWREQAVAGREAAPQLDAAEGALRAAVVAIPGAAIERKRFSIAVHWRNTPPEHAAAVEAAVDAALAGRAGLRRGAGKKVFELLPAADWNKGRALLRLLQRLDLERPDAAVLFAGDDLTDEDAFRVVRRLERGVGVLVREGPGAPSHATVRLRDPDDLARFLERLMRRLPPGGD